ncbi:MAG: hypothetical protein AAFP17_05390 [Pseudomonadota bacterium]
MLRIVVSVTLCAIALAAPAEAYASAAAYEACSANAEDKRALRQCNTFRTEVAECNERRADGLDGPAECLGEKVEAWRSVMESEEARAAVAGIEPEIDLDAWTSRTFGRCRDAEQIRLSTERFGAPHAAFEALSCELRAIIRRTLQRTQDLKGL